MADTTLLPGLFVISSQGESITVTKIKLFIVMKVVLALDYFL